MIVELGGTPAREAARVFARVIEQLQGPEPPVRAFDLPKPKEALERERIRGKVQGTLKLQAAILAALDGQKRAFFKAAGLARESDPGHVREAVDDDLATIERFLAAVGDMTPQELDIALETAMLELYSAGYVHAQTELGLALGHLHGAAIEALKHYAFDFADHFTKQQRTFLVDLIRKAFTEGKKATEIVAVIRQAFGEGVSIVGSDGVERIIPTDTWAMTVARTEIARAQNAGIFDSYTQAGVSRVMWLAADDERTCPVCNALDGQTANLGEPFEGTDVAQPPEHPNCRCTLLSADAAPITESFPGHAGRHGEVGGSVPRDGGGFKQLDNSKLYTIEKTAEGKYVAHLVGGDKTYLAARTANRAIRDDKNKHGIGAPKTVAAEPPKTGDTSLKAIEERASKFTKQPVIFSGSAGAVKNVTLYSVAGYQPLPMDPHMAQVITQQLEEELKVPGMPSKLMTVGSGALTIQGEAVAGAAAGTISSLDPPAVVFNPKIMSTPAGDPGFNTALILSHNTPGDLTTAITVQHEMGHVLGRQADSEPQWTSLYYHEGAAGTQWSPYAAGDQSEGFAEAYVLWRRGNPTGTLSPKVMDYFNNFAKTHSGSAGEHPLKTSEAAGDRPLRITIDNFSPGGKGVTIEQRGDKWINVWTGEEYDPVHAAHKATVAEADRAFQEFTGDDATEEETIDAYNDWLDTTASIPCCAVLPHPYPVTESFPGHAGRPGERGGSVPRDGGSSAMSEQTDPKLHTVEKTEKGWVAHLVDGPKVYQAARTANRAIRDDMKKYGIRGTVKPTEPKTVIPKTTSKIGKKEQLAQEYEKIQAVGDAFTMARTTFDGKGEPMVVAWGRTVKPKALDPVVARVAMDTIANEMKSVPGMPPQLYRITAGKVPGERGGTIAMTTYTKPPRLSISVKNITGSFPPNIVPNTTVAMRIAGMQKNDTYTRLNILHEMGHVWGDATNAHDTHEWTSLYVQHNRGANWSEYAKSSRHEGFAEAYTIWRTGNTEGRLPQNVIAYFNKTVDRITTKSHESANSPSDEIPVGTRMTIDMYDRGVTVEQRADGKLYDIDTGKEFVWGDDDGE